MLRRCLSQSFVRSERSRPARDPTHGGRAQRAQSLRRRFTSSGIHIPDAAAPSPGGCIREGAGRDAILSSRTDISNAYDNVRADPARRSGAPGSRPRPSGRRQDGASGGSIGDGARLTPTPPSPRAALLAFARSSGRSPGRRRVLSKRRARAPLPPSASWYPFPRYAQCATLASIGPIGPSVSSSVHRVGAREFWWKCAQAFQSESIAN